MPFTGPAEDRAAIRELYDTYADGANRGDRAAWLGCFAEDGTWKTHYFEVTGRNAIGTTYDQLMVDVSDTVFMTQIGSIEVTGDTARARAFCAESLLQKRGDGSSYELTGQYQDELVRRDGRWFFLFRNYLVKREIPPVSAEAPSEVAA